MESSRRDLSNDMAEHKSILKNNQTTLCPRFSVTPKTGIAFPKTGVLFLLWTWARFNNAWVFRENRRKSDAEVANLKAQKTVS